MISSRILRTMCGLSLVWLIAGPAQAVETNGRFEISADYRYATQASEPVADAKALACREAWRLAVINSSLYREQTASVVDSPLLRNLAYVLAAGHVQDQQIVEQTVQGRTISCRVHGYLPAEESTRIIRTQLAGSPSDSAEQNRALRIVSTAEEGGYLLIQFQALKRLDWPSTAYQGTLREIADIMVDFYDETGQLIRTERHPARHAGSNQSVLNPGMLGLLKVPKPLGMATYRVWLVK
jgi:hypothetical protein